MSLYIKPGHSALSNMFFDTTHEHVQFRGGLPRDLIIDEGLDTESDLPFKGNVDIDS